jgi:hypothetical protein
LCAITVAIPSACRPSGLGELVGVVVGDGDAKLGRGLIDGVEVGVGVAGTWLGEGGMGDAQASATNASRITAAPRMFI